ncbi:MAG: hypothetical protein LLG04_16045 [Parachlamydia sp.]|nr:hypothetical protein [Parachlamydia sp.]
MMVSSTVSSGQQHRIEAEQPKSSTLKTLCSRLYNLRPEPGLLDGKTIRHSDVFPDSKPFVRWWWLNGPFKEKDIHDQLKWLKGNGFGGVEIAWLFPFWESSDYKSPHRVKWLSEDFIRLVTLTKKCAAKLELGCDFTFGSSWPFGGSFLKPEDQMQTFQGPSSQRIEGSWEKPLKPPVLNHLSRTAVENYTANMSKVFEEALKEGRPSSLFCDSLEIDSDNLWSPELWKQFEDRFGYSLKDHLDALPNNPLIRYDTRKIVSDAITQNFYQTFTELSHKMGAKARVQCHGAPTDLLSAYASVDVPESESLLFEPGFSRIAASAASLASRPVVSCETFTCMYDYPDKYKGKEQLGDLKLLFDALIANGVNQVVWHGMPYNPVKNAANRFFASVHVGPDASFAKELPKFNQYMEDVCGIMRLGKNAHQIAVYLPNEDMMMLGKLPRQNSTAAAHLYWEMRDMHPPEETKGLLPVWLSGDMLSKVSIVDGRFCCGDMNVPLLYIDVKWLDRDALAQLLRLVQAGGKIVLKNPPNQPGFKPSDSYIKMLDELVQHPNTLKDLKEANIVPLVQGDQLPPYWAREYEGHLYLFIAHPNVADVKFPIRYGQFKEAKTQERQVKVYFNGKEVNLDAHFAAGESLMVCISPDGKVKTLTPR